MLLPSIEEKIAKIQSSHFWLLLNSATQLQQGCVRTLNEIVRQDRRVNRVKRGT